MLEMFRVGGPFMYVVVLFGLGALACNVLQFVRKDRDYTALLVGLVAATFLAGISGTSAGLYHMASAVTGADPDKQFVLYMSGLGIANTTTGMACALASLNAALAGLAVWRRK